MARQSTTARLRLVQPGAPISVVNSASARETIALMRAAGESINFQSLPTSTWELAFNKPTAGSFRDIGGLVDAYGCEAVAFYILSGPADIEVRFSYVMKGRRYHDAGSVVAITAATARRLRAPTACDAVALQARHTGGASRVTAAVGFPA